MTQLARKATYPDLSVIFLSALTCLIMEAKPGIEDSEIEKTSHKK